MCRQVFFVGPLLLIITLLSWSQQPFQNAPPGVEEALRARVSEYYAIFQQGKFRQGEAYVTEESKDAYYSMKKTRHLGLLIKNVIFSDDVKNARVLVTLRMIVPMVGAKPVPVPVASNWKLVDGEWYAHFPLPKPGAVINTPFGKKTIGKDSPNQPTALSAESPFRPTPESLDKLFSVGRNRVTFPTNASGPITETIFIENHSQGRLEVQPLSNDIKGLRLELSSENIESEKKVALDIVYEPAVRQLRKQHQFRFRINPIGKRFVVKVDFQNQKWIFRDEAGVKYGKSSTITPEGRQSVDVTHLAPNQMYRVIAHAKMLEGDIGEAFITIHGAQRQRFVTGESSQLAVGEQRMVMADFKTSVSAKMTVGLQYRGTYGRVAWSEISIIPLERVNLTGNGGFESPNRRAWKSGMKVKSQVVPSLARNGKKSMRLSGETGYVYQDITDIVPGRHYELRAWALTASNKSAIGVLTLRDGDESYSQQTSRVGVPISEYELLSIPFVASNKGTVRIHLAYRGGEGSVNFDDVSLLRTGVSNGGFESDSLESWVVQGGLQVASEQGVVFNGYRSLEQIGATGSVSQTLGNLDATKRYQIIAWVRSDWGGDARAVLKVADGRIKYGPKTVSSENFEPFVLDFESNPDGTIRIDLGRTEGSGSIYWDDVFVRERR